jgi:hypothetical protein
MPISFEPNPTFDGAVGHSSKSSKLLASFKCLYQGRWRQIHNPQETRGSVAFRLFLCSRSIPGQTGPGGDSSLKDFDYNGAAALVPVISAAMASRSLWASAQGFARRLWRILYSRVLFPPIALDSPISPRETSMQSDRGGQQ